jgi:hypothetical protein
MSTIVVVNHPAPVNVVVNKVDVPASKGDLLVDTDNTITINMTNNGSAATGTLTITINGQTGSTELENFTGEQIINVNYNPTNTGSKDIKIDITYPDQTT